MQPFVDSASTFHDPMARGTSPTQHGTPRPVQMMATADAACWRIAIRCHARHVRIACLVLVACQGRETEAPRVAPPPVPISIALGGAHTCVLREDGIIRCFGANQDHQLGNATAPNSARPLAVEGVRGVALAAGSRHTCAVTAEGSVACWGANGAGQLGDGTRTWHATPQPVIGLAQVVQLAAAGDHTCARRSDGSVWCWGANAAGQLGLGDRAEHLTPAPVAGVANAQTVVAGATHTCVLIRGGEMRCWGDNQHGELGDGTRTGRSVPAPIANLAVVAIAAGDGHSCAIGVDRRVRCWGDASPSASPVPWIVTGVSDAVQLAIGAERSLARTAAGTVVSWRNAPDTAQTLDRPSLPRPPEVERVAAITGATDVVAGVTHFCARLAGREIRCWGDDSYGQRGDGEASVHAEPVVVSGLRDIAQLALGSEHSCARLRNGTVQCWGSGHETGQLGDGLATDHPTPATVPGLDHVTAIALGSYHTCALQRGGAVQCWGNAARFTSPVGDAIQGSATPTPIVLAAAIDEIIAGGTRTCVRDAKGAVACWDVGSRGPIATPVRLPPVRSLSVGERHACAVLSDGAVACWGENPNAALGDGTRSDRQAPTRTMRISTATQVAVGISHTCALLRDATVACWGANDFGQLGNGSTTLSLTPVPVPALSNVVQIGAGGWTTCALRGNGTVSCWGMDITGDRRATPTVVPDLTVAVELAVGYAHACARLGDGTARCWGVNRSGQLGDGDSSRPETPSAVAW
jgi:alpha-tubulin suppressor-like RCC1 family protein